MALFHSPTYLLNLKPNVFPTKFQYPTKPINLKLIFSQKDAIFYQKNSIKTLTKICSVVNGSQGGGAMKEQKWTHEGLITESLSNGMFKVGLENGDVILGHVSGKIRQSHIRILPGDRVNIEVSRYDSTRGRITYRLRSNKSTP